MIETYKAPLVPEVIPLKPRGVSQTLKPNLIGMTRSQMGQALIEIDTDPKTLKMRISQLWSWIYQKLTGTKAVFIYKPAWKIILFLEEHTLQGFH